MFGRTRVAAGPQVSEVLSSPGRRLDSTTIDRVGPALRPLMRGGRPSSIPVRPRHFQVGATTDAEETHAEEAARAVVAHGPGAGPPLQPAERHRLESVRIHTDSYAARSADLVGADAYAVQDHIVFASSRYDPHNVSGRRLIAHELAHVLAVPQEPPVLRRQVSKSVGGSTGGGTFSRARTVSAFVALVREAERRLQAAGVTSVDERIQILSGIYYGTDWSLDLEVEKSQAREAAFRIYTARAGQGRDPRPILGTSLFDALKHSQDVSAPGIPDVDVGHVMIGLNARSSWSPRNVPVPTQGGTGLEIATWVGDLGAATGRLARDRVSTPHASARAYFPGAVGTDYGADSNLEGDIASYLAGAGSGATSLEALSVPAGGGIADALAAYFGPRGVPADRASRFLTMVGGTFSGATLDNRSAVEATLAARFAGFGRWYVGTRYGPADVYSTSALMSPAAADVAHEFVEWLLRRAHKPSARGGRAP
jgi:hypothetical protein